VIPNLGSNMGGSSVPSLDVKTPARAANHIMSETPAFACTSPPDVGLNEFLAELPSRGLGIRSPQHGKYWAATLAWRVRDEAHQLEVRKRVTECGSRPTPVIDRFWFKSIYFRDPGGVLLGLATDGPVPSLMSM
jgi:catechol 2,3-dioxygenase-like lactoylglutathione lyase family enzyme